ncbi:MAG: hypothetical protein DWQ44_13530 [Bacteroidetes bacterium]|nr:MAG: hypothetical protein DWQ33_08340 [Bacteroidota bacterium]REK05717.1 MAG: hypothetical protein DWQ39_04715 [Bacteroidota bacterium]REK31977.1 MAG: hypothetical protein DWQ44_13530 [Bacteroidota bacterium]REK50041.1 MAG: hypothetical protein DWQ48_05750 [Bacteroidota bacterium]
MSPSVLEFTVFDQNGEYQDIAENDLITKYILQRRGDGTMLDVSQGDYDNVENGTKRFRHSDSTWNSVLDGLK